MAATAAEAPANRLSLPCVGAGDDTESTDLRAFALTWFGLRFARPETETAYVGAWIGRMLRPARIAAVMFLVFNVAALATNARWMYSADVAAKLAWVHGAAIVVLLGALAAGYTAWGRAHFLAGCLACALAAPAMTITYYAVMPVEAFAGQPLVGAGQIFCLVATLVLGAFGFVRGAIASAGFTIAFHFILLRVPHPAIEARSLTMLFHSINVTCLLAAFLGERRDRRLFANEQLLRRARERSERLLRRDARQLHGELRQHVAARSRALSEALVTAGKER